MSISDVYDTWYHWITESVQECAQNQPISGVFSTEIVSGTLVSSNLLPYAVFQEGIVEVLAHTGTDDNHPMKKD